jgi:hypothetical protein
MLLLLVLLFEVQLLGLVLLLVVLLATSADA